MYCEISNNRKRFFLFGLKVVIRLRPSIWRVLIYRLFQKLRTAKTVCYTCLCGDYDKLESHYHICPMWDYICFTDNENLLKHKYYGIWKIMPLCYKSGNPTMDNRWHKFFPYKFLEKYESSIYIDANVNVLTKKLERVIAQSQKNFLLPQHPCHNCLYEELTHIVNLGKDTLEHMEVLRQKYEKEKFPHHFGCAENNVIYSVHSDVSWHPLMEEWWQMLQTYSKRDQASLAYILWKNGLDIKDYIFGHCRLDTLNFCVTDHKRK